MASLTSFLPHLPNFGLSVPALYERQRALVRLGHLPAPKGRGRGAGVEASPKSVAMLIAAVMATDNLSDTDSRVRRLANSKPDPTIFEDGCCELTGASTFAEALEVILDREEVAKRVDRIDVSRSNMSADIWYRPTRRRSYREATTFGPKYPRDFDVTSHLSGELLMHVGKLLRNEAMRESGDTK
ncbi:hypothetical protein ACVWZ6_005588 [Bradyrhizobium sp. GM6.1]